MPEPTSVGKSLRTPTPREQARARTVEDIVRLGRRHLAEQGAAALSLRAVARDLGVVSSAVYRYVESRDELLTLLLIDSYNELGDAVDRAVDKLPEDDFKGRFLALTQAVRRWAVGEPACYALLFGSPVPGYQAPGERTTEPGTRVVFRLVGILDAAYRSDALRELPRPALVSGALAGNLAAVREELGVELPEELMARGVLLWTSVFGAVSFEVFGQYGPGTFPAQEELFAHQMDTLAGLVGL